MSFIIRYIAGEAKWEVALLFELQRKLVLTLISRLKSQFYPPPIVGFPLITQKR